MFEVLEVVDELAQSKNEKVLNNLAYNLPGVHAFSPSLQGGPFLRCLCLIVLSVGIEQKFVG